MFRKAREYKEHLNEIDEDKLKDTEFEKGDAMAMFIAAVITFVPPILITCAAIYFVVWLIFLR